MVKAVSFSLANRLILVVILLAYSGTLAAQRRGSSSGGSGLSTYGRPDGVDEKDSLKDFQTKQSFLNSESHADLAKKKKENLESRRILRSFYIHNQLTTVDTYYIIT